MRRILRARLLTSVLALSVVPLVAAVVPAQAQMQAYISFDSFHDQLAPYGDWVYSDRWGMVWLPEDVPDDFRPYYTDGYWTYADDYGWTWVSDYEWGDIVFHYGRWVDDPYDGWMWIPGYTWSPGWVVWRSNDYSVGWMAMPPDDNFLSGQGDVFVGWSFGGVSFQWNDRWDDYGYSRWYGRDYDDRRFASNWTFVDIGHMADRDYRRYAYDPRRTVTIIHQTTNITNYTVVNNYIVNRSVDVHMVEQATGRPIRALPAVAVFRHPNLVTTVDAGQRIRVREFNQAPHGMGIANSAPPPSPVVIDKLSEHVAARHAFDETGFSNGFGAGGSPHLFTKTSITNATMTTQFRGKLHVAPMSPMPANPPFAPSGQQGMHATSTGGMTGGAVMRIGNMPGANHPVSGDNAYQPSSWYNNSGGSSWFGGNAGARGQTKGHSTGSSFGSSVGMGTTTGGTAGTTTGTTGWPFNGPSGGGTARAFHPTTVPVTHPYDQNVQHPLVVPAAHNVAPVQFEGPPPPQTDRRDEFRARYPVTEPSMQPMMHQVPPPTTMIHTAPLPMPTAQIAPVIRNVAPIQTGAPPPPPNERGKEGKDNKRPQ